MVDLLVKKYPRAGEMPTDALFDQVIAARQHAQKLGLEADQHIFDVVEAHFIVGEPLWIDPEYRRIFAAPMRTREEKCVAVRDHFVPQGPVVGGGVPHG